MSLTTPQPLEQPTLPEGQLLYAVGDIHGRSDLLRRLLDEIAADAASSSCARTKNFSSFSETMSIAGPTAKA